MLDTEGLPFISFPKPMEEETAWLFSFIISSSLGRSPTHFFFLLLFLWRGGSFFGKANMGNITSSMATAQKRNPLHLRQNYWGVEKERARKIEIGHYRRKPREREMLWTRTDHCNGEIWLRFYNPGFTMTETVTSRKREEMLFPLSACIYKDSAKIKNLMKRNNSICIDILFI